MIIIKILISLLIAVLIMGASIVVPIGIEGGFKHEILNTICIFLMFTVSIVIILGFLSLIIYGALFCQ